MLYLVTYDLRAPDTNYPDLIKFLQSLSGIRMVRSDWLVESTLGAAELRDTITTRGKIDQNDRLLVVEVRNHAAWLKLLTPDTAVVEKFKRARA